MRKRTDPLPPSDRARPEPPPLRPGEAHVWSASLDLDAGEMRLLEAALSPDERERADRFAAALYRQRWIAARGILRSILSTYLRVPPAELRFSYTDRGKPFLPGSGAGGVNFNLSHSEDAALIAVTQRREIGVDIEHIRENRFDAAVARRFFSKGENEVLGAAPEAAWAATFFALWTRKEACMKASGLGFALSLRSFDVSVDASTPRVIVQRGDAAMDGVSWTVVDIESRPGYAAACAVEGRGLHILPLEFRL